MFQNEGSPTVIHKRMSFLSMLVLGVAFVLVAAIVSITGITIYGMRIIDHKTTDLGGLLKETVQALPAIRKALPPALADTMDDERLPLYRDQLKFTVRMNKGTRDDRAIVEVENRGDRVVTLLSMRLIGLDKDGDPVVERNTWAATPIQAEHDWRGPLLPGETRRFTVPFWTDAPIAQLAHEVTDLRVWRVGSSAPAAEAEVPAAAKATTASPADSPKDDEDDSDDGDEDGGDSGDDD